MIYEKGKVKLIKRSVFLGIFFIITNFTTISLFKNIEYKNLSLSGAEFITIDDITQNSSLKLPMRLILIKTKLIENELTENMSLKKVSVNRQLFPFELKINMKTREPIALAEKISNGKKVTGFIDEEGIFINKKFLPNVDQSIFTINISGWEKEYKIIISKILKTYKNNKDLSKINISDGFIILVEKDLNKILLGYEKTNIDEKLNLILDIKNQLKNQKLQKKIKSLDLTDLRNPKLKVFIP